MSNSFSALCLFRSQLAVCKIIVPVGSLLLVTGRPGVATVVSLHLFGGLAQRMIELVS
jgi:hypothetical protein